eukprot:TRINITY_DN326_c0_g1_i4.p1 TRINITY_DN326_c0_g1~~TRINITY_DN326_c0_g1_i4.p1  ORF type:complete len:291 (-),score=99.04 TRINITY_DN326_c0_g1_i4:457-1329(-)
MGFDVKRFDVYRKIPKDLTQPTVAGAVISICCSAFIILMLITEFWYFITPDVQSELLVENANPTDRIPVRINVSLPRMKCEFLGIDIQDDMGRHEVGFVENTAKTPIYDGAGCLFEAHFHINKVPGNFHVSTHSVDVQPDEYNFAHEIHEVSFGSKIKKISSKNIGTFNSLSGRDARESGSLDSHEYVMKIVPTTYESIGGTKLLAYQYTYAYRSYVSLGHGGRVVPAIWFRYDLNPITVKYHETRPPIYHFLTTVCAIVGGTFTVAGIIDSSLFTATELFKKFELGKLS